MVGVLCAVVIVGIADVLNGHLTESGRERGKTRKKKKEANVTYVSSDVAVHWACEVLRRNRSEIDVATNGYKQKKKSGN